MTKVLIGIGGTGSKIVESALFLLAAGIGSSRLSEVIVGLVDQDGQNGNCGRAQALLTSIRNLQAIRSENDPNRLEASAVEGEPCEFLSIRLTPLFPAAEGNDATPHWCPETRPGQSLSTILDVANKDEERQALLDLLYARGEQELELDGGYQGRAHLGAAAMRAMIDGSTFEARIAHLLDTADSNLDVRVFLAGSVFGGTGAAGFPTIARHIDRLRRTNKDRVPLPEGQLRCRTGGVLMLPYFAFQNPEDEAATVLRSNETLRNSRVALEYYERLADEDIFDRLFINGWDKQFNLNYHAACGAEQKNPPLPPEIFAALAAIDFLTEEEAVGDSISVCARHDTAQFSWHDLPRGDEARDRLGRLLRMAVYWRLSMADALTKEVDGNAMPLWRRALADDPATWNQVPRHLDEFFEKLLVWAVSNRLFSGSIENLSFEIWDSAELLRHGTVEQPAEPVEIFEQMEGAHLAHAYSQLIPPRQPAAPTRSAADLFSDLNDRRRRAPTGRNKGLGRLIAELHRAARTEDAV